MRIQQLEIDRFGVWEKVKFSFDDRGVSMLYGPNEAGKSTLMRFIRGVLYGFQRHDETTGGPRPQPVHCSGTLYLTHHGKDYIVRRTSKTGTRGQLEINGQLVGDQDALVKDLTGEISESMFENIFAIGLPELQQLATLNADEVAEHIYGLSLGPEGEQIFRAQNGFRKQEQTLIGSDDADGELRKLLNRLRDIDQKIERIDHPTTRHAQLISRIESREGEIAKRKRDQATLEHNLKGHQFLLRVWEPWHKERQLRKQLDALPVSHLDRDILDRLDELEKELSDVDDDRKSLINEARRLQKEAEAIKTRPGLEEHMCRIQFLQEKTRKIRDIERNLDNGTPTRTKTSDREVQALLSQLDGHWDTRRLETTDVSPTAMHRLMDVADSYRRAGRKRSRNVKKYKKMTASLKRREKDWKAIVRDLDVKSIPEARDALRRRLGELEELRDLKRRQGHLKKTSKMLERGGSSHTVERQLPEFFWSVLILFVVGGFMLFAAGAYAAFHDYKGVAGGDTAWIVGLIYALMGCSALGLMWTMKQHFSQQELHIADFTKEREAIDRELLEVTDKLESLKRRDTFRTLSSERYGLASNDGVDVENLYMRTRQHLMDLDDVERESERIDKLRRSMSRMRQSLQDHQKEVSRTRRDWTDSLRHLGLAETLKVPQAFAECQRIADAKLAYTEWMASHNTVDRDREDFENYHREVEMLAGKIEGPAYIVHDAYQLVANWHNELELLSERRRQRNQFRQDSKNKRREAARLVDRLERMREQRATLFQRLGVADRGEIIQKLAAIDERKELEGKIAEVHKEVQRIAESEPQLAITEEELLSFEQSHSRKSVEDLRNEIAQLEDALQVDYENVGQLKQELRSIEDDRSVTTLRFDREQILDEIRRLTERWCATRLADRVMDQLCERLEHDRQPSTLLIASDYLNRLTCGKYHKIWTPLGQKVLLADDDMGQSISVEHLSAGTREQVFLALRLAMIREFANDGLELPIVLDDVTVNFDQGRTEAAVDTLLDVAEEGQQILLFTCHLHLAHMFENRGIEPLWLPQRETIHG